MKKFKNLFMIFLSIFVVLSIPTFAQSQTMPQSNLSYDYGNLKISDNTNFQTYIDLSPSQSYGKAYYYNTSEYDATLYVEGQEIITIKPYSYGYIIWQKDFFKKNYTISITATSRYLDGTFSLAKIDDKSNFQN